MLPAKDRTTVRNIAGVNRIAQYGVELAPREINAAIFPPTHGLTQRGVNALVLQPVCHQAH